MASVKRTVLVPWIAVVVPTAQMSVAETAAMLVSAAFAKLVPDGAGGTGTGTTDQAVPSQCSASGRASLPWPTAQALAGLRSATSYSDASLPPLAAAGVAVRVHAVPFHCAARVSWLAALMLFVLPTAPPSPGSAPTSPPGLPAPRYGPRRPARSRPGRQERKPPMLPGNRARHLRIRLRRRSRPSLAGKFAMPGRSTSSHALRLQAERPGHLMA